MGGALRELQYRSSRHFTSDLDFVIEVDNSQGFRNLVKQYSAKPNRFGGHRISLRGIDIDFWEAERSWAHIQGYSKVSRLEDIVHTTFFNVDAILYIINERRIEAKPGTLEALRDRYLDINLLPNPNPLGATVRALRRMCEHKMRASELLTAYIARQIDNVGWQKILLLDETAYGHRPILRSIAGPAPRTGAEFAERIEGNGNRLHRVGQLPLPL